MTPHLAIEAVTRALSPDWRVEHFRRIATERGVRNSDLVEQSLSLSSAGLLYDRNEGTDRQFASEQSSRNAWVVHQGDLVVNPMWLFGGAIGVSDRRGAVSPDYRVYALAPSLEPRYIHHLLRSGPYRDQYRLYMRAETTFDRRVTKHDFNEMPVLIPPIAEQRAIADYLDAETHRTEKLIEIRRQQVRVLTARTESLIASVLDPLIESGGEVPLKAVADVRFSGVDKKASEGEIPVLLCNYTDVYYNRTIDANLAFMEATATTQEVSRFTLRVGDVLLTKDSETPDDIGIASVVTTDLPGVVLGYHLALARPRGIDGRFLCWALRSRRCRDSFSLAASGVTRFGLRQDAIARVPIPNLDPRTASTFVSVVESQVAAADAMSRQIGKQIDLLVERRQALITAAVAGQLEIPGVAA